MKGYYKKFFTGKVNYQNNKQNEFTFELEEDADLTDEIEKSLIEIKRTMNISEDEINEAIRSRRILKTK